MRLKPINKETIKLIPGKTYLLVKMHTRSCLCAIQNETVTMFSYGNSHPWKVEVPVGAYVVFEKVEHHMCFIEYEGKRGWIAVNLDSGHEILLKEKNETVS